MITLYWVNQLIMNEEKIRGNYGHTNGVWAVTTFITRSVFKPHLTATKEGLTERIINDTAVISSYH